MRRFRSNHRLPAPGHKTSSDDDAKAMNNHGTASRTDVWMSPEICSGSVRSTLLMANNIAMHIGTTMRPNRRQLLSHLPATIDANEFGYDSRMQLVQQIVKWSLKTITWMLIMFGAYLLAFGNSWSPFVLDALHGSEAGLWLELLVPFLPLLVIGIGAALFTRGAKQ